MFSQCFQHDVDYKCEKAPPAQIGGGYQCSVQDSRNIEQVDEHVCEVQTAFAYAGPYGNIQQSDGNHGSERPEVDIQRTDEGKERGAEMGTECPVQVVYDVVDESSKRICTFSIGIDGIGQTVIERQHGVSEIVKEGRVAFLTESGDGDGFGL